LGQRMSSREFAEWNIYDRVRHAEAEAHDTHQAKLRG
jgi:hypothetical protein